MTLDDIYEALSTGELAQVVFGEGGPDAEGVQPAHRKKLRHSIQMGLTDLHGRFLIREKAFTLDLVDGKTTYALAAKYAKSNSASQEAVKYIDDTADPFEDDLLKLERLEDADGDPVALNELDNDDAVRTLSDTLIAVPSTLTTDTLKCTFRANHPQIDKYIADAAPMAVTIALPTKYLQALLYFVASRALNPVGFREYTHEGNNYMQKYEMECQRLAAQGAGIEAGTENGRVVDPGWV